MRVLALLLLAAPLLAQTYLQRGIISADSTLSLTGSPYIVQGTLSVYGSQNPRLTIEPGVELRFVQNAGLVIANPNGLEGDNNRGQLWATGTAEEPIRFVANTPGQVWGGVRFYNSADFGGATSQLEHAVIAGASCNLQLYRTLSPTPRKLSLEEASADGLMLYQCVPAPTLENLSVTGSAAWPLTLYGSALPQLIGVTTSGNGMEAARYTGTIVDDLTLDLAAWPFPLVFDDLTEVASLACPRLTLPAGTELRFLADASLCIGNHNNFNGGVYCGQLTATGTEEEPIRFVADTPGQVWGGLRLCDASDFDGAQSQLEHVLISGADCDLRVMYSSTPVLQNLVLEDAAGDALLMQSCYPAPALDSVTVRGAGGFALSLIGSALPALNNFSATDNGDDRACYTGTISADLTLDLAAWPQSLVFKDATTVVGPTNPRLTLPPGTELRFLAGARLNIADTRNIANNNYRGQLTAVGTGAAPVRFVADTPGQTWGGLRFCNSADFGGAASQLEHAQIAGADCNLRLYKSASPELRSLVLEDARDDALLLEECRPAPAIENLQITGSGGFALSLDGSELPALTNLVTSGNGDDRARYYGVIAADLTLDLASWPHALVFSGLTSVFGPDNPRLTLPPGTELRFLHGASLHIAGDHDLEGDSYRGQLRAVGTAEEPVCFVADTPGDFWVGLCFHNSADYNGAASELEHARIADASTNLSLTSTASPTLRNLQLEGARHSGLQLISCIPAPAIENVSVNGSAEFPLVLYGSALPELVNFSASGNGDNRAGYGGTITRDLTLDPAAWPWPLVICGQLIVAGADNPRLTLPAGTELRFQQIGRLDIAYPTVQAGTSYRGQLTAVGTVAEPVRFVADDPELGWLGVRFNNSADYGGASSELRYARVEGARDGVTLRSTDSPELLDLVLAEAENASLTLLDAYPLVQRCCFLDSGRGLYVYNADTTIIGDTLSAACTFMGNHDWDLYNDGPGAVLARHNGLCTPNGELISDRIFDQLDDPAKGLVSYDPLGEVGLLRVTVEYRPATEVLHMEWCPLFGATSYTIYGQDTDGYAPVLVDTVATTMNTWLDIPLADLPHLQFYTVTGEVSAAVRDAELRGGCR